MSFVVIGIVHVICKFSLKSLVICFSYMYLDHSRRKRQKIYSSLKGSVDLAFGDSFCTEVTTMYPCLHSSKPVGPWSCSMCTRFGDPLFGSVTPLFVKLVKSQKSCIDYCCLFIQGWCCGGLYSVHYIVVIVAAAQKVPMDGFRWQMCWKVLWIIGTVIFSSRPIAIIRTGSVRHLCLLMRLLRIMCMYGIVLIITRKTPVYAA